MTAALELLYKALDAGDLAGAQAAARKLRTSPASTQLAAEVLHELRQPLLGIKAHVQLLAEESGARGALRSVLAQVERMEQIISDFTRLASGRPAPQQQLSLLEPVQAAVRHFSLHPEAARLSIQVEVVEDTQVTGNGRLLEQLVLNLLNNARDAAPQAGRVKVVLTREAGAAALYVADWGPGISEAMRERLFEPYSTTRTYGTGLGLAVCRRIAEEHHARLELASPSVLADQPPPSTLFRLLFPSPAAPAAQEAPLAPTPRARPEPPVPRGRLLVVDDEQIIREVVRELMGRECEVLEAATAEQALEQLQRGPVDVLLTDKNMPGLSGLELAERARQLNPRLRVLMMTGYPSVDTALKALGLGVEDYLLKPFDDIRQVRARLRKALATPPEPAPAPAPPEGTRRVDVLEDDPESARLLSEALELLGLEVRILAAPPAQSGPAPAGVVVSWDLLSARGREALELGHRLAQGAPLVVTVEHLTLNTTLEVLRAGAVACLSKPLPELPAMARELARVLQRRGA